MHNIKQNQTRTIITMLGFSIGILYAAIIYFVPTSSDIIVISTIKKFFVNNLSFVAYIFPIYILVLNLSLFLNYEKNPIIKIFLSTIFPLITLSISFQLIIGDAPFLAEKIKQIFSNEKLYCRIFSYVFFLLSALEIVLVYKYGEALLKGKGKKYIPFIDVKKETEFVAVKPIENFENQFQNDEINNDYIVYQKPSTVENTYNNNPEVNNQIEVEDNVEDTVETINEIDDEIYGDPAIEQFEDEEYELAKTKIAPPVKKTTYTIPSDAVLKNHGKDEYWIIDNETKHLSEVLTQTLEEFNIQAEVIGIKKGPVITMFEILPAPGIKISRIQNLSNNIALRLAATRVRIVAPIPGKQAVGVEIPNKIRSLVSFKEIVDDPKFKVSEMSIPAVLGKNITGEAQIIDITATPHLLIAGSTGSGKSVCVNSIITSILYKKAPDEVKLLLIDPKQVELNLYNDIPHLLTQVITDHKKAFMALQYCLSEMERRYNLLTQVNAKSIRTYNEKIVEKKLATLPLPYIVVVIDEFADLMLTSKKDIEVPISRLAAMARAVGIHLILATQRPSVDVITGIIKANFPSRIAFMTTNGIDSRTILDETGAEKLLGRGDMLYISGTNPFPTRIQGAYLSESEVEAVVKHVKSFGEPDYIDDEIFIDESDTFDDYGDDDPLMDKAIEIVATTKKASASFLQRKLSIGYNRAARITEIMEAKGYIGPINGSKPREVFINPK